MLFIMLQLNFIPRTQWSLWCNFSNCVVNFYSSDSFKYFRKEHLSWKIKKVVKPFKNLRGETIKLFFFDDHYCQVQMKMKNKSNVEVKGISGKKKNFYFTSNFILITVVRKNVIYVYVPLWYRNRSFYDINKLWPLK